MNYFIICFIVRSSLVVRSQVQVPFHKERQAEGAGCKREAGLACMHLRKVRLGREQVEQLPCLDIQEQQEDPHTCPHIQTVARGLSTLEQARSWEEEVLLRLEHIRHKKVEEGVQLAWHLLQGALDWSHCSEK